MKRFEQRDLKAAYAYAKTGGQALHVISGKFAYVIPGAPAVFKGQKEIAHLIDNDVERLMATARRLGVRVVKVGREGQHVDLCRKPLERALAECDAPELALTPEEIFESDRAYREAASPHNQL